MKTISKMFALAVFCVSAAAFAADVKINDTAFPAKGNTFTRSWSFLTHVSAAKELKLAAEDFAQHPKLKGIAGVTKSGDGETDFVTNGFEIQRVMWW